jgi:predicted RNA binding protein YcfA (HicA-like mRNA interferase family)
MKPVSGKRLCKLLESRGWAFDRTRGSHFIYVRGNPAVSVAVPVHGNRDLKPRTQRSIMRQAGLTDADL